MDLRALELFLNLASTLHFGKTGRQCHISTSALSRLIQRLEGEIGEPLFVRDNRTVELSEVGKRFRAYAQEVVDGWHHFVDSLEQDPTSLSGEILLYSSVTAAGSVLSDLFKRFRASYPRVHIRLETGDAAHAVEKVAQGAADITVAAKPDELPGSLRFKTVTSTPLIFIAPTTPCDVTDILDADPVDWSRVPLILAERALSRRRAEAWFRSIHVRPNIYAEVAGHEAIIAMVALGCGVGVVPELVYDISTWREGTRVLDVEARLPPYEVGLCVNRKRLTAPAVRAFWEIVEHTDSEPASGHHRAPERPPERITQE